MSLQSYIAKLRAKPEHERRRVSFWYAFSITAVIFVFWLSSFSFSGSGDKPALAKVTEKVETPAKSLLAAAGSLFFDVKEMIFGPKKIIYSEVQVLPGNR